MAQQFHIESNIRMQMVDDLLKHHSLIGKSRAEVLSLLGPSSMPSSSSNPDQEADLPYYPMGKRYSGEWVELVISFENDRVVDATKVGG